MWPRGPRRAWHRTVVRAPIPCYTGFVANLTIVVDDEILRSARIRALRQGTSVNAVLAERLREYADEDGRQRAATQQLLDLSRRAPPRKKPRSPRPRPTRDELHER